MEKVETKDSELKVETKDSELEEARLNAYLQKKLNF